MDKPFIIGEMSGNHNQSINRALQIVDAAAASGCHALKIQTYTQETMTIDSSNSDFVINDQDSLWSGEKLYDLYKKASTPYEWHKPIFDRCREQGIIGFSTPFDISAVDFLEDLNCPIYKIASFENGDIPLLKKVGRTKKPVIMSLGMIGLEEIHESVEVLTSSGCNDLTLLKCTSTYPADPKNTNLLTIPDLKKRFPQCKIGLSDHTMGIGVSVASVAIGAEVIEKHFTLARADGGVDSAFSIEPAEMRQLVTECKNVTLALGTISYEPSEDELKSFKFRRSLYVVKDIKMNEVFSKENVRSIRPGFGLHPRYYEKLLGKTAKCDLKRATALKNEHVEW